MISDAGVSNSNYFSSSYSLWWKSLWKLNLPTKIKLFVWRACNNLLPTNEMLALRRVPVCKACPLYNFHSESILHSLWCCQVLNQFVVNEDLGLLCVCFWKSWSLRNAAFHGSPVDKEMEVVSWARLFISEYHDACELKDRLSSLIPVRNPIWIPPDPRCFKINCDAAINMADRTVGFVVVIRNSEGLVMAASS
ncbi:hypothetical protein LWI29_004741 [Acer saccharum]|uniref:Reverse transcriptase zinc-binding domain-containing protein n=1 Tax=Acer saccharum TaxID=4024 RepID=A0AA39VFI7_ACESA|nr:hypothetical protein LWI29_004741 [Acer saccharum]